MPTQNTTYTLTATGQGGATTTCTISLQVTETGEVPRIVRFSADPSTITAGDSSTLSWTVEGATNVSISGGIGTVGATGTRQVTPPTTTTYTLTASNAQGNVTATATVTVNPREPPPPPPPTGATLAACLATPATSARPGDPVRLTWTVTNTSSLTVSGGGQTYSPPITGPLSVSPQATTTYIITAQGPQGSQPATCQIVVNVTPAPVNPPPQAIIAGPQVIETIYRELTLDASPSVNPAGGPLTYTWEPLETGAAVLDQGQVRTRIQLAGLFGDYRIRLTVRNAQGQTASTIVTVRFLSAQLF
jgi:hypothetical protein